MSVLQKEDFSSCHSVQDRSLGSLAQHDAADLAYSDCPNHTVCFFYDTYRELHTGQGSSSAPQEEERRCQTRFTGISNTNELDFSASVAHDCIFHQEGRCLVLAHNVAAPVMQISQTRITG